MYYADNSHETQIAEGPGIRAIGWLDNEHPFSVGPTTAEFRDRLRAIGVPGEDCLFVAPEMVAHYVDAHQYRPPEEFVEAVLECPDLGTPAYAAAVHLRGA